MIEEKTDSLLSTDHQNDLIACNLLKAIDRVEQFAVLYSIEDTVLQRLFETAIQSEEYEICQVIKELMGTKKTV